MRPEKFARVIQFVESSSSDVDCYDRDEEFSNASKLNSPDTSANAKNERQRAESEVENPNERANMGVYICIVGYPMLCRNSGTIIT